MTTIYTIGDVHSDTDTLRIFADYVRGREDSYILCNGDLLEKQFNDKRWMLELTFNPSGFLESMAEFTGKQLHEFKSILDSTALPWYAVYGNYEPTKETAEVLEESFMHNRKIELDGFSVFGQGGADAFPAHINVARAFRPIEYDIEQVRLRIEKDDSDYLLLHNPLKGLLDNVAGENTGADITDILESHEYNAVFSGHIHEEGPLGKAHAGHHSGIAYYVNSRGKGTFAINPGNLGETGRIDPMTLERVQPDPYFGLFAELETDKAGNPLKLAQYTLAPNGKRTSEPLKIAEFDLTKAAGLAQGIYHSEDLELIPEFIVESILTRSELKEAAPH
ncbi:TPA: hypothetical protein HA239_03425 [Candidatus Woesearchaeota archaeon]|nr:hypothetical protein QT06_C0001G0029 [archaeon GW2011_AR15]MBS3104160.1 metallophosphoesterase family protein [Candidatus Woesearchaeota archaeon]HIH41440.1 hypothetical protein [Candidatus Woesearchaeota archaeon]